LFKVPLATPNVIPSEARDLAHDRGSHDLACVVQNQAWDPSLRSGWHSDEKSFTKAVSLKASLGDGLRRHASKTTNFLASLRAPFNRTAFWAS